MAPDWNRTHFLLEVTPEVQAYSRRRGGGGQAPFRPDRAAHGGRLAQEFSEAQSQALHARSEVADLTAPERPGIYVEFDGHPGFDLAIESMQSGAAGIELRSVKQTGPEYEYVESATVFVPDESIQYFLTRFEQYLAEDTRFGRPRNANLVDRIENIRVATLRALWTDPVESFPEGTEARNWEVWLRHSDGSELARFSAFCEESGVEEPARKLVFGDRAVTMVRTDASTLSRALVASSDIAEVRGVSPAIVPVWESDRYVSTETLNELAQRAGFTPPNVPFVVLMDAGVTQAHPLIAPILAASDQHTCDPTWGTDGLSHEGHGTEMAGLAAYGEMTSVIGDPSTARVRNRLESVKIVPPRHMTSTPEDLWGVVSATAVALVEGANSGRRRVFQSAVTSGQPCDRGIPTSWSHAVDALAFGHQLDDSGQELTYLDDGSGTERLFVLSAGNVDEGEFLHGGEVDHLAISDATGTHAPAQAWNALTVGAFTNKAPSDSAWQPLAEPGELSPHSSTSRTFADEWPLKPDVVFEGGNGRVNQAGDVAIGDPEDSLVTTYFRPNVRHFTVTQATSAASAQVARVAARVMSEYPSYWPETVRGMLVHSAEWTPAMYGRLSGTTRKVERARLVRRYGFGVPDESRLLRSADSHATMILQERIHPFDRGKLGHIHFFSLPWPSSQLDELGETVVRMRVTLSYFIEPNAGRRGWRGRYSYASHGLRFDIGRRGESGERFRKRLNDAALAEDERRPPPVSAESRWFLGPEARNKGSIHSDHWIGPASELMAAYQIAVYPVGGWWMQQQERDRSETGTRYSLLVTIDSGDSEVDVWGPLAAQLGLPDEESPIE